jgi:hypothetical protein
MAPHRVTLTGQTGASTPMSKRNGKEMIMSQQSTPLEASGFGIDVVRRLNTAATRVAIAIHTRRQAQANCVVRSIIVRYSDDDLAHHGWSAEDIRRLKSH